MSGGKERPAAAAELVSDGMMSVAEAVKFSGLSQAELYRKMTDGSLAFLKSGRRRLIPKRALLDFLAAMMTNAG